MSAAAATTPSADNPISGSCLCGGVRFQITAPFERAFYCHCTHCQKRTGGAVSAQGRIPQSGLTIVAGADLLRSFAPPTGRAKVFCSTCGSSLFSGDPLRGDSVSVRLGTLDGDPGVPPAWRAYVGSAASWEPVPEDELPRFVRGTPASHGSR